MNFLFPYSESKIKPYLKMATQRIQLANNKRSCAVKIQKKGIADLLAGKKEEKAMIKVEHIIREDFNMEGYEILELLLELVHERIRQVTNAKDNQPPKDLEEALASLIWAADNVDIDELKEVRAQLGKRFGQEFVRKAALNEHGEVNERLADKLSYREPSGQLVLSYLQAIAESYSVDWAPSAKLLEEVRRRGDKGVLLSGSSVAQASASGITQAYGGLELTAEEREEAEAFARNQPQPACVAHPTSVVYYAESVKAEHEEVQATPVYPSSPVPAPAPVLPSAPSTSTSTSSAAAAALDPLEALQARLAALNRPGGSSEP